MTSDKNLERLQAEAGTGLDPAPAPDFVQGWAPFRRPKSRHRSERVDGTQLEAARDVSPSRSRARFLGLDRPILFILAWVFLVIGIIGVFMPFVPGTLFLIFAAACFTRSSPRFEMWLLDHPRFGPPVRKWRARGAIPRNAKVFAFLSLVLSWWILYAAGSPTFVLVICLIVFVAVALYVASRPEA